LGFNVANVVVHTDLNCLSTIQFAVDVLRVAHIIVCGHYGCGGVRAVLRDDKLGLIDNWLRHVQDVRLKHKAQIDALATEEAQHNRLCELNVIEQVVNVSQTTVVREAWTRGQAVAVHGWVYGRARRAASRPRPVRDVRSGAPSTCRNRTQHGLNTPLRGYGDGMRLHGPSQAPGTSGAHGALSTSRVRIGLFRALQFGVEAGMTLQNGSALLLAAILIVGAPAGITLASETQAKDDIKHAGKAAKEAGKSVGEAGKDVGIATAEGAKQGAKAFKKSLTRGRGHSHKRSHTGHKAKGKSAKTSGSASQ
jgi:hypothetical protein